MQARGSIFALVQNLRRGAQKGLLLRGDVADQYYSSVERRRKRAIRKRTLSLSPQRLHFLHQ